MNYNSFDEIAKHIRQTLEEKTNCLHKPQLKFLPYVISTMITTESVVALDIAKNLKSDFTLVQLSSNIKRFQRLMKNKRYEGHKLFDQLIKSTIMNLNIKHKDKRVHIVLDHTYSGDNYTILASTMRVGKQGIPIFYKVFDSSDNSDAFTDDTLIEAVNHIHNLFADTDCELIFLADRWFNSYKLLKTIEDLNHTYVIRFKGNVNVETFDKKRNTYVTTPIKDLYAYEHHACYYNDVFIYEENKLKTNITCGKKKGTEDRWIIATNGDPKRAIKDYSYRYGAIETNFKNTKSNCFYIEDVVNASVQYYDNLYATMCIAILLCTCIGTDYSKNKSCYKNVKIATHKNVKNKLIRIMSIFATGLTLFQLALNSKKQIRLPLKFILYDV